MDKRDRRRYSRNDDEIVSFHDGQPVYRSGEGRERSSGDNNRRYGRDGERRFDRDEGRRSDRDGKRRFDRDGERRSDRDGKRRFDHDEGRRSDRDGKRRFDRDGERRSDRDGERRFDRDGERRSDRNGERRFDRDEGRRSDRDGRQSGRSAEEPAPIVETAELPNIIMGRNPVKEAIKSGRSIDRILVNREHDGSMNEILDLAHDRRLVVRDVDRRKLDELCMPFGHNGRTGNHQGIVAYIPDVEYCELSDILDYACEKGEHPFVVLLDGVEDPHNLGSIIRSAECAGAHGVVITKRRSALVTATVAKTSAGATEHMRIAKVVNLVAAMEQLKAAGLWIAGADMGGDPIYSADLKGPFALVVGAEGAGLSRLVREKCDYTVSIPLAGKIESLNASVAAAVIMFEKVRQERK